MECVRVSPWSNLADPKQSELTEDPAIRRHMYAAEFKIERKEKGARVVCSRRGFHVWSPSRLTDK